MIVKIVAKIALWALLLIGLFSAGSLSYQSLQNIDPCPLLFVVRACYIVFFAYLAMAVAALRPLRSSTNRTFWAGWFVATGFAVYGSLSELIQGNTCPQTESGLPMCYISLAFCVVIALAFITLKNLDQATPSH